jgi:Xaa-Pro aminopeptidase
MDFQARRDRLRKMFKTAGIDALLVTDFTNVTYLTGFTGDDSYLLVRRDGEVVLSDPRYTTQLGEECPGVELNIRPPGVSMLQAVVKELRCKGTVPFLPTVPGRRCASAPGRSLQKSGQSPRIGRLGIEGDSMTVGLRDRIAGKLPKIELIVTSGLVEHLRLIKDKHEIARLREAIRQAQGAFAALRSALRPEMTEKQAADELEHQCRLFGAKESAFPPIVAVGARAALPHATPTQKRIEQADFVLIDWGANEGLYRSDLTRVLVTGRISAKFERIYRLVLKAQTRAIAAIRPGVLASDVDNVARTIIAKAGYGRRFRHGLGHGLGLLVHEAPRLAVKSQTILKPGMVVTVEPGIYLPGWGGVRIEDDVLVTRTGHEVLTDAPKGLEEVVNNVE